jgi:hypothetical protein
MQHKNDNQPVTEIEDWCESDKDLYYFMNSNEANNPNTIIGID